MPIKTCSNCGQVRNMADSTDYCAECWESLIAPTWEPAPELVEDVESLESSGREIIEAAGPAGHDDSPGPAGCPAGHDGPAGPPGEESEESEVKVKLSRRPPRQASKET